MTCSNSESGKQFKNIPELARELSYDFVAQTHEDELNHFDSVWQAIEPALPMLSTISPKTWESEKRGISNLALGAYEPSDRTSMVPGIIFTMLACLYHSSELGAIPSIRQLHSIVDSYAARFQLTKDVRSELKSFMSPIMNAVSAARIAVERGAGFVVFKYEDGKLRNFPEGTEEIERLRTPSRKFKLLVDDPSSKVYLDGKGVRSFRTDTYEYHLLVYLLQRTGETWEEEELLEKIALIEKLKPEAIGTPVGQLVERLRKRFETALRNNILSPGKRWGLGGKYNTCLILRGDSKYLQTPYSD